MGFSFSDTTNKSGLLQRCEFYTNLGDGAITGDTTRKKQFTEHINAEQHLMFLEALDSQDGWDVDDINHGDYAVLTTPMTTNRDYVIPATENVLAVKRVDVTYDGSTYYRATPFDSEQASEGFGNDSDVDGRFSKSDPHVDLKTNAVWLYPKGNSDDVNNGGEMRFEWSREATEFSASDTTKESFLPSAFRETLAQRVSHKWLIVKKPGNTTLITRLEGFIRRDSELMQRHYSDRETDRQFIVTDGLPSYD